MYSRHWIVLVGFTCLCSLFVQRGIRAEEKYNTHVNPRLGVLASTSISAATTRSIESEAGGEDLFAATPPPILASLSAKKGDGWTVSVTNTTSDHFTLYLQLVQFKASGAVLSRSAFSVKLKAKGASTRAFARSPGASGAQLVLRKFKNRSGKGQKR